MKDLGSEVYYQSVDVSKESNIRRALEIINEKFGDVAALVHGAGVLADHHIEDLKEQDYLKVIDTKLRILNIITKQMMNLKYLALFSSSTVKIWAQGAASSCGGQRSSKQVCSILSQAESERGRSRDQLGTLGWWYGQRRLAQAFRQ